MSNSTFAQNKLVKKGGGVDMEYSFNRHDKVILRTFHNTLHAPSDVNEAENYWKLIGSIGRIVSDQKKGHPAFPEMGERVLVKFDDVEKLGLICHNETSNSLWIFLSDLVPHST